MRAGDLRQSSVRSPFIYVWKKCAAAVKHMTDGGLDDIKMKSKDHLHRLKRMLEYFITCYPKINSTDAEEQMPGVYKARHFQEDG